VAQSDGSDAGAGGHAAPADLVDGNVRAWLT